MAKTLRKRGDMADACAHGDVRMRQNIDGEWYHIMASSARITVQRAGPSLPSRPETHIRGQEGRVNTGWPPPFIGQKSSS